MSWAAALFRCLRSHPGRRRAQQRLPPNSGTLQHLPDAALLQLAPRLCELVLNNYFKGSPPPCLVAKQGLETLQLIGSRHFNLFELPQGPYLSSKHPAAAAGV